MTNPVSPAFDPAVQISANGMFRDAFLTRYRAVRAIHKLPVWQIAKAAKFSPAYLGNATRFAGDNPGDKLNVSTAFASRLAAVVKALEQAHTDEDVQKVLNPGANAVAVAPSAASPSQREEATDEGDEIDAVLAYMRRKRIASLTLTL